MPITTTQIVADGRYRPTYDVSLIDQTPNVANYILLAINAPAGKAVYLRRMIIWNIGIMTAAQKTVFELVRLTAASAGGAVFTPQAYDVGNVFGGIALTGNPTVTASGTPIARLSLVTPTALTYINPIAIELLEDKRQCIMIPPGVANGVALRVFNGAAGAANLDVTAVFSEEPY